MAQERKSTWHTAREFATHWLVGGLILAATGFVPEEWLARALGELRISDSVLHLWGTGVDLRLGMVAIGVALIAGDITWRNLRRRPAESAAQSTIVLPQAPPVQPDIPPLPDRPSIAVLPFANPSNDPEQEYFSDGVADDIITELSRSRSLFVIARNSSFTYRGRSVDVRQVSRELGVRYVLEGSARRDDGKLRVNVQLIDAETGNHVWAERYDRDVHHIFAVQDEVTVAVSTAIVPAIGDAEQRRVLRKPPGSLSAWETYQRGLWHLMKVTPADNKEARILFERAAVNDPTFASAHVGVALARFDEAVTHALRPVPEAAGLIVAAARRAIAIDPDDPDAQAVLAMALMAGGDGEGGLV